MKKVVCFCRVSSSAQDLTEQRTAVVRAIRSDRFKPNEIVYVEGKESAIKLDEMQRQTLNELKEVIATTPTITDVYFYAIDRLARRVNVVLSVVEEMIKQGINLHFLNPYPMQTLKDGKEDAMGKMFLTFLSIGAEMEMKMKNERFETKRKGMREAGQLIGGNVLYGYYRSKSSGYPERLIEEAKVVEDIFNWYVEGMSMKQIAKRLICNGNWNAEDFKTLNSAVMKVSKIINNPAYSGRTPNQYDSKEEKTIKYPAIVDVELQDQAMQIAANNKREKDTSNIYYGKGLVKTMVGEDVYTMSPIKGNGSYCLNYNGVQIGVNINVLDTIIWRNAKALYTTFQAYEEFTKPSKLEAKIKENEEKIDKLQPIFDTFAQREERTNRLYKLGRTSDEEYEKEYQEIENEKKVYINEKIRLENENKRLQTQIGKLSGMRFTEIDYTNYTDEEKRELAKDMITSVMVEKVGKFDYDIFVNANESIFNVGVAIPYYHYNCAGGVKKLLEIVGERYTDITNEIEMRFKQPKRVKVIKKG